jgi:hypothetical protein
MNRYTIYNPQTFDVIVTGFYEEQPENSTTSIPEVTYYKARYNPDDDSFFEGATEEEILQIQRGVVPDEVALWKIRAIVSLMGLEQSVTDALNLLPEPNRTAAIFIWDKGNAVDRVSLTVNYLQQALELTDSEVDNIFIEANKIVL